jgi:hypothetical protein
MRLVDFKQNEQLNHLRKLMGAEQLGSFELFDPDRHLSWENRQLLAKQWLPVNGNDLHSRENTLYFKNSPVVAQVDQVFHFALCDDIKKRITHGLLSNVAITTNVALLAGAANCTYCLHAVGYEGFDVYRHRHQQYNEKILKDFRLIQYIQSKSSVFKL